MHKNKLQDKEDYIHSFVTKIDDCIVMYFLKMRSLLIYV